MKFEHTKVMNFEGAFRSMRNPLSSWDRSDSASGIELDYPETVDLRSPAGISGFREVFKIGPKDMELAQKLVAGGSPHRKFLRQILVSVDITAPEYFWNQWDTYKVGTVANSTSKMHKLSSTPVTVECFETDDYDDEIADRGFVENVLAYLEYLRNAYNKTGDKRYWKELIRWLPEGWLQTRTVTLNYEVIRSMCYWREGHKLSEWKALIDWAHTLPYAEELIFYRGKETDCGEDA